MQGLPLKKRTLTPWIGIDASFVPVGLAGFVYLVTNVLTSKAYIGKKFFWAKTHKKVKGKKRRKLIVKESDWRTYRSSSDGLKRVIDEQGLESFRFEILSLHRTRAQVNYEEIRQQFIRDVLYSKLDSGDFAYLNLCILNRYYRGKTK
jgi:hypothetical protein